MTDLDPAMVERLRVILFGNATFGTDTVVEAIRVRAALRALPLSAAAALVEAGRAVVAGAYAKGDSRVYGSYRRCILCSAQGSWVEAFPHVSDCPIPVLTDALEAFKDG